MAYSVVVERSPWIMSSSALCWASAISAIRDVVAVLWSSAFSDGDRYTLHSLMGNPVWRRIRNVASDFLKGQKMYLSKMKHFERK